MSYKTEFEAARDNPEAFWKEKSEALLWFKDPEKYSLKITEPIKQLF